MRKNIISKIKESPTPSINLLSPGTVIRGNITVNGNLRFDGSLYGDIKSNGKIILGSSSYIEGNIICESAEIGGEIKGDITSTGLVVLKDTSKFEGEMKLGQLKVEVGAILSINCNTDITEEK